MDTQLVSAAADWRRATYTGWERQARLYSGDSWPGSAAATKRV